MCEFVNLYSECIEKKITAEILIKKTVFKAMSKNIMSYVSINAEVLSQRAKILAVLPSQYPVCNI